MACKLDLQTRIDEEIAACKNCGSYEFPKRSDCDGCTDAVEQCMRDEIRGDLHACLDSQISIGASTPEPSLWDMVRHYYRSHGVDPVRSRHHADKVCDVFVAEVVARLFVPT